MVKGRFSEEQEIIDRALKVKHCIPGDVKVYLSHFLRNGLTEILYYSGYYKNECNTEKIVEIVDRLEDVLKKLGV